jgi:hypothetical protein
MYNSVVKIHCGQEVVLLGRFVLRPLTREPLRRRPMQAVLSRLAATPDAMRKIRHYWSEQTSYHSVFRLSDRDLIKVVGEAIQRGQLQFIAFPRSWPNRTQGTAQAAVLNNVPHHGPAVLAGDAFSVAALLGFMQSNGQLSNLTSPINWQIAASTPMLATSQSDWFRNTVTAAQIVVDVAKAAGGELTKGYLSYTVGNTLGWTNAAIDLYNALETGDPTKIADALFKIAATKTISSSVPYLLGLEGTAAATAGAFATADFVASYEIGKVTIAPLVAPIFRVWTHNLIQ